MRYRFLAISFLFSTVYAAISRGQTVSQWINAPLEQFTKGRMCYDYQMLLVHSRTQEQLDAVAGRIYKSGLFYLDSNSVFINVRDKDNALQIDVRHQVAYVKSIKQIESRIKDKVRIEGNVLFDIEEMVAKKIVTSNVRRDASGDHTLTIIFNDPGLRELVAVFTPGNSIKQLSIKVVSDYDGQDELWKVLTMRNFQYEFPETLVSAGRFFNRNGLKMKGIFSDYAIRQLRY